LVRVVASGLLEVGLTGFYLGIFAASVLLSFILTRYVRALASARGWVETPSAGRHLHIRPLPRLGGVAVFLSFVLSVGLALLVGEWYRPLGLALSFRAVLSILLPGTVIFLLGVYDDVHPIGPYAKFAVQGLAAAMLFAFGLRIFGLPLFFGHHTFSWIISFPLTVLWVLAITNAFNLIDGLDGLAAGSALFSTLVVFVVALVSHSPLVSLMTLVLAGAILGFLRFNFNPATIFLGDCGSLFIGFVLSALALRGMQKTPTIVAVAIPVVSFGLPILETSLSVLRRFISGRPVFSADREHIHHKLLQLGLSQTQVVIVLYAVSAVFALLSLFLLWPTGSTLGLVLLVLGTGIWLGVQHLGYLEFGELRRVAQRTIEQRQIFVNNLAIRRATEELRAARDYEEVCSILLAAFTSSDFDAFDLRGPWLPEESPQIPGLQNALTDGRRCLRWRRQGSRSAHETEGFWTLSLTLVTASNHPRGSMIMYRAYGNRDLQLDINLLTSMFPVALAEALDRTLSPTTAGMITPSQSPGVMAAQAG
jgi:UDP-GlcNAc:undecaprenyl-phosphate/decaprenyl-phosphate GlcNAc-1-phosphate transferase